jgi:hypothetical protein
MRLSRLLPALSACLDVLLALPSLGASPSCAQFRVLDRGVSYDYLKVWTSTYLEYGLRLLYAGVKPGPVVHIFVVRLP